MLQLSQTKIGTWQACKRKFQLRYVTGHEWPQPPFPADASAVIEQGEIFHMLAAQSYLLGDGFAFDPADLEPPVDQWWEAFQTGRPMPKKGQTVRVESTLTASLSQQIKLIGRLDLLFIGENGLEIFDWKTGNPRRETDLRLDWQTRIYLALLYQSRAILGADGVSADQLSITYWYPRDPQKSVKISYDEAWHATNWAEMSTLSAQIETDLEQSQQPWPLTNNLKLCSNCGFNVICGREPGPSTEIEPQDEDASSEQSPEIEVHPDL